MAKRRITMPKDALGAVKAPSESMRSQPPPTRKRPPPAPSPVAPKAQMKARPGSRADQAYAGTRVAGQPNWKAPSASVQPSRAGASYTPGSKADMAYTGVQATTRPVVKRPVRVGGGLIGAGMTAAAAAGLAAHDKLKKRGRKLKKDK